MNMSPAVWYSSTAPTAVYPNNLYIWEVSGFLQLGVAVPMPIAVTTSSYALVVINSLDNGVPDAGLYTTVIRKIVSAYKTGLLKLEWSPQLDVLLGPVPPAVANNLSTVKDPYLYVRYDYSTTALDTITLSMRVTDNNGFVMANNKVIILTNILTIPALNEDSQDVLFLPASTLPSSQAGDFSTASSTLLPVKTLVDTTTFDSIQAYWYGTIPTGIPSSFDCKQLAIWKDSTGKFQFGVVLPLDEILTNPDTPIVKGTIAGVSSSILCFGSKWWHVTMLTSALPSNGNVEFLSKVLLAVNDGVLFLSDCIPIAVSDPAPKISHPITNSLTINVSLRAGQRYSPATGFYYAQSLGMDIYTSSGEYLATTTESVRIDCPSGTPVFFPGHLPFISGMSNCSNANCWDDVQMEQLAEHGPNSGINVLQGRGGVPTGTELTAGSRVSYWDLSRQLFSDISLLKTSPYVAYVHSTSPDPDLYIPYLGLERSIHSNHTTRAAVLGYSHYYYPDIFHPLDVGKSDNFGTIVNGANYATFNSSNTAIVADDDHLFAVLEAAKGKCVFLCSPMYNDVAPTTQESIKAVPFYLPYMGSRYTTIQLVSDDALTLDLSVYRKTGPVFNTEYGKPNQEHNCIVTYTDGDVKFSGSTAVSGGSQYIGFSSTFNTSVFQINHGLILPSPSTSVKAFTGLTNYPEFAVPFTTNSPSDIIGSSASPYAPSFVGRLPPNYKMIWVDWTSITATTITVYYWMAPEQYDLSTVYTSPPPTVDQAIPLTLTLTPASTSLITFDGTLVFGLELSRATLPYANIRLFAGDTVIAEDSTGTLPWINTGTVFAHGHGNSNLNTVVFTNLAIVDGRHANPLDGATSADYVELQVDTVGYPITAANYASLDLKPYRLYWNVSEKALYMPVLRNTADIPTQLAKVTFFSNQPLTNPFLVDLLDNDVPTEHVFLSNNHGLANIPYLSNSEVFTSLPISGSDTHVLYYWRTGTNYETVIGPMIGQIVSGVTVPTQVKVPSNGGTSVINGTTVSDTSNLMFIGNSIVINGADNNVTYGKFPLCLEDSGAEKYTVQFSRVQNGAWQSALLSNSHFGLYMYPTRPDTVGVGEFPLMPKPQERAIRVLFPSDRSALQVQSSSYRGYTWNQSIAGVGTGILTGLEGESIIAIEVSNKGGNCELRVYENQQLRYVTVTDVPYFNNGCIVLALVNATYQSTETIGSAEIVMGGPRSPTTGTESVVYCVPTTSINTELELLSGIETTVASLGTQMKYGYANYGVSNTQLSTATVQVYMTQTDTSMSTLVDSITLTPTQTVQRQMRYIHRNEKLVMVSSIDGIKARVSIIIQL